MLRPKGYDAKIIHWVDAPRPSEPVDVVSLEDQTLMFNPSQSHYLAELLRGLVFVALDDNVSEIEGADEAFATS